MKGVYVLIIQLREDAKIQVGAIGEIFFTKGLYAYVGSAQNGLEKRIERHLRKEKPMFWHIDYLLGNPTSRIMAVFFKEAPKTSECAIAETINQHGEAVVGFGCSDCHCKSHLFRVDEYDFLCTFMHKFNLNAAKPDSSRVS